MDEFFFDWHGVMRLSKWTQLALVLTESREELERLRIAFPDAFRPVGKPSEAAVVKLSALMHAKAEDIEGSGNDMCLLWLDLFTDLCSVAEQCGIAKDAILKFGQYKQTPVPTELQVQISGQRLHPAFPVQYDGRAYVILGICFNPVFGETMEEDIADLSLVSAELIDADH